MGCGQLSGAAAAGAAKSIALRIDAPSVDGFAEPNQRGDRREAEQRIMQRPCPLEFVRLAAVSPNTVDHPPVARLGDQVSGGLGIANE